MRPFSQRKLSDSEDMQRAYNFRSFSYKQKHYNRMDKRQRGINEHHNKAIIDLIRRKISPLHPRKKHQFANPKSGSNTFHVKSKQNFLPSLPPSHIYDLHSQTSTNGSQLIDRVKDYLQVKRRENHLAEKKSQLAQYISIFQRPISRKERIPRQSIELNIYEFDKQQCKKQKTQKKLIGFAEEEVDMDDDARSILNAKIRRKLNHKKLIDMVRRF